jgi:hypothetical protein
MFAGRAGNANDFSGTRGSFLTQGRKGAKPLREK